MSDPIQRVECQDICNLGFIEMDSFFLYLFRRRLKKILFHSCVKQDKKVLVSSLLVKAKKNINPLIFFFVLEL